MKNRQLTRVQFITLALGFILALAVAIISRPEPAAAQSRCTFLNGTAFICAGSGSPESVITAPVGSLFIRTDGAAGTTLYLKETGAAATGWVANASGTTSTALAFTGTTFASLGTPSDGTVQYCSDCTIASPCAGAGTGALAKRLNGAWVCD